MRNHRYLLLLVLSLALYSPLISAGIATTGSLVSTIWSAPRKASFSKTTETPRDFIHRLRAGSTAATSALGLSYYGRVALAGGLAGATGTTILYPLDSAKTLRQSNPKLYSSVKDALLQLLRSKVPETPGKLQWHISKAYRGLIPAAVGAIPSSALYFGAYESSKRHLEGRVGTDTPRKRMVVHGLAAASGNTLSSGIFVPKEVIKQHLQCQAANTVGKAGNAVSACIQILKDQGIGGMYRGYQATLMRNIPSAMLRFVVYEELKRAWGYRAEDGKQVPAGLFCAGAVAGGVASGLLTPVDVVKTRLATGTCPAGTSVITCFQHVVQEMGWKGLYTGAGSRMIWSGAFAAIGFSTFELVKGALGVADSAALQAQCKTKKMQVRGVTSLGSGSGKSNSNGARVRTMAAIKSPSATTQRTIV